MKKNGHKLLTLAALLGTATGVIHITNRFIDATSQLKDMLEQPHGKTYDWRFGKIHYTKQGHGSPLLLVHDIMQAHLAMNGMPLKISWQQNIPFTRLIFWAVDALKRQRLPTQILYLCSFSATLLRM